MKIKTFVTIIIISFSLLLFLSEKVKAEEIKFDFDLGYMFGNFDMVPGKSNSQQIKSRFSGIQLGGVSDINKLLFARVAAYAYSMEYYDYVRDEISSVGPFLSAQASIGLRFGYDWIKFSPFALIDIVEEVPLDLSMSVLFAGGGIYIDVKIIKKIYFFGIASYAKSVGSRVDAIQDQFVVGLKLHL